MKEEMKIERLAVPPGADLPWMTSYRQMKFARGKILLRLRGMPKFLWCPINASYRSWPNLGVINGRIRNGFLDSLSTPDGYQRQLRGPYSATLGLPSQADFDREYYNSCDVFGTVKISL
eukprot:jgi/Picre1/33573/NNA_008894.t1